MNPDQDAAGTAALIFETGTLRDIHRTGWSYDGIRGAETVAEHSHRTTVIGIILAATEGADPARNRTAVRPPRPPRSPHRRPDPPHPPLRHRRRSPHGHRRPGRRPRGTHRGRTATRTTGPRSAGRAGPNAPPAAGPWTPTSNSSLSPGSPSSTKRSNDYAPSAPQRCRPPYAVPCGWCLNVAPDAVLCTTSEASTRGQESDSCGELDTSGAPR
ncbi:HD domain-containing protein [Kitasatospora sp. NPDC048239]|uniref:HD domain-containing protein n=1 Tax=Kitasatospora sp. NPDC048239 TaxID=3364046 RepID=UPI003715AA00